MKSVESHQRGSYLRNCVAAEWTDALNNCGLI